eukprot:6021005-Lingulodinium_polyedra.AAC.1
MVDSAANCDWQGMRCPECRGHRRTLIPRLDFPAGAEFTAPQGASGNLGIFGADAPSFITFDRGARGVDGHHAAAGAAIAWERAEE